MDIIKETKGKKIKRKLLHKYRMVVLNEDTFEERFSFKLTRLNVFVVGAFFALFLITATTIFIAYTPIREYIPGYSSTALKLKATKLTYQADSLEQLLGRNTHYLAMMKKVLTGDLKEDISSTIDKNSDTVNLNASSLQPNAADSLLREEVAQIDKFNFSESSNLKSNFVLFQPVSGTISQEYLPEQKHYAVDIVVPKNTPIKSVADGTVIFAEWTADTGHVIIVDHSNYGLVSVYKHNALLTKEQGDLIKAGEVVAMSGGTGELSTGPHLHFELWSDGYPVNPTNYIDFR